MHSKKNGRNWVGQQWFFSSFWKEAIKFVNSSWSLFVSILISLTAIYLDWNSSVNDISIGCAPNSYAMFTLLAISFIVWFVTIRDRHIYSLVIHIKSPKHMWLNLILLYPNNAHSSSSSNSTGDSGIDGGDVNSNTSSATKKLNQFCSTNHLTLSYHRSKCAKFIKITFSIRNKNTFAHMDGPLKMLEHKLFTSPFAQSTKTNPAKIVRAFVQHKTCC